MLADDRDPRHYGGRQAQTLVIDSNQGYSNGPTEAVSPLIKKVKRREHGFRNFANYRLQLLLHTASRGRLPDGKIASSRTTLMA